MIVFFLSFVTRLNRSFVFQLREQSMRRKQQDKDFNEKKFNLSLRDAMDEKEPADHQSTGDQ